ncbi:GDSL esterase/lipase At1g23500-like [Abrus precatorius]|uniref:GDSL esterase/lipase At1g23500-like n=1 Tax=Abrus precatorius TaxID=3816 RepID=A0A8B8MKU6_ABRPR|nr:GDSL esterase/lipase At1g23500-like [Abrus precatorius]
MDQLFRKSIVTIVLIFFANRVSIAAGANGTFPALFSFGDSILDTGNNNNLQTLSKCNFPPYGMDFEGGKATGRFCDGKIPSDLIASGLGIKDTLPAYLDGNLKTEDLPTGVCFASGGSGNDDTTARIQGVLTLSAQLGLFKEYIGKLRTSVGQQRADEIISNSLYLISSGNNDIAITYQSRRLEPFPLYADQLVGWASNFLKSLYELGARRVWVLSTLPLGCLPGARSAGGGPLRACEPLTNLNAQSFNSKLSSAVNSMKTTLPNSDIRFVDVYTPLLNIIQNPSSSGFVNVALGCCATGTVELGVLCNRFSQTCGNPSTSVFWDAGHPTQKAYELVVSSILQSNNA